MKDKRFEEKKRIATLSLYIDDLYCETLERYKIPRLNRELLKVGLFVEANYKGLDEWNIVFYKVKPKKTYLYAVTV